MQTVGLLLLLAFLICQGLFNFVSKKTLVTTGARVLRMTIVLISCFAWVGYLSFFLIMKFSVRFFCFFFVVVDYFKMANAIASINIRIIIL